MDKGIKAKSDAEKLMERSKKMTFTKNCSECGKSVIIVCRGEDYDRWKRKTWDIKVAMPYLDDDAESILVYKKCCKCRNITANADVN